MVVAPPQPLDFWIVHALISIVTPVGLYNSTNSSSAVVPLVRNSLITMPVPAGGDVFVMVGVTVGVDVLVGEFVAVAVAVLVGVSVEVEVAGGKRQFPVIVMLSNLKVPPAVVAK